MPADRRKFCCVGNSLKLEEQSAIGLALEGLNTNMKSILPPLLVLLLLAGLVQACHGADVLDLFKGKTAPAIPASLSDIPQDQMVTALREALSKGIQEAVATLGQEDGFLKTAGVKIPMPESLQKVEKTLRTLRQEKLADEFVITMNRAAEQAVPEAAHVLGDSVRQLSIADARSILTGTNNAATQYFRRTTETNLYTRFLPIVKNATEKAGVTAAYKRMSEKAGGALGGLGGLGGGLFEKQAPDLDSYVTRKTLDGLFVKISEQEKKIRENPAARTTELLQKVFGSLGK